MKIPSQFLLQEWLDYNPQTGQAHEAYGRAAREHFGEFARAA